MIFPLFSRMLSPFQAPATYFLLLMNIFVFFFTYDDFNRTQLELDQIVDNEEFLLTQGQAFSQYVALQPRAVSPLMRGIASQVQKGEAEAGKTLGSLSLRNPAFMKQASEATFAGDEVALTEWKKTLLELQKIQKVHPSYRWGLSYSEQSWPRWISYQFAHSGGLHLFWNMVFLVIFGFCLEVVLGPSLIVLAYLSSGILGALGFAWLSGLSESPLVGASAAVSGLMGLVSMYYASEKLRYFYWLLPTPGYYGFVFLPAWLVVIVFAVPDLAGFVSSVSDYNSVAYTAHLCGFLWGAIMGCAIHFDLLVADPEPEEPFVDA